MNVSYLRGIYLRLAGSVTLVVMLALVANAFLSHRIFERALAPQIAAKVGSVGSSVRALVFRAVDNGFEFRELYGVTERFQEIKGEVPEISYIGIADPKGEVLYRSADEPAGAADYFRSPQMLALGKEGPSVAPVVMRVGGAYVVSMPLAAPGRTLGMLHLGVNVSFIDDIVLDMLLDVVVVLVVALFFTLELLHFIAGAKLEASLKDLGDIFERGAAGDFTARRRTRVGEQAFGSLVKKLESMLLAINASYTALAQSVEAQRRVPARERSPELGPVQIELKKVSERFRFGVQEVTDSADNASLAKIRAPLFVFILAEELTRSFLPSYTKDLLVDIPGLSPQLVIGLPIALFMLIVALSQPFLGLFCERKGHKYTMTLGATIAALGFFATAAATSVLDLLMWRSLCAAGYAMVFVAGQAYVLDHASSATKAKSFALFVGAIMAATVCGPSIGGILADNIGIRPAFVIAGLLAVISLGVIRQQLPDSDPAERAGNGARLPTLREVGQLLVNKRFMMVTALAAMPAKILLTGVCFYLIPLYVLSIGSTQSMSGRILMAYAVVMVVMAPVTAALATSRQRMHWLVGGGLVVSGAGGLLMVAGGGIGFVLTAVLLIGLGQSMSISAQSALVSEHCAPEAARIGEGVIYGVYRLLERIGNALGPMIAGAIVLAFDYRTGFVAIGTAVLACGVAFLVATRRPTPAPELAPASAFS